MTTKNIRKNINFLRALRERHAGRVPTSIQQKINNVVDFLKTEKLVNLPQQKILSMALPRTTRNKEQKG